MKKFFLLINIVSFCFWISSCKDKYDVSSSFEDQNRDSLLTDIITYIYVRPQYAEWNTRFDSRFRTYYVYQLAKFRFERYYRDDKGIHYYYIIRPARSPQGNIRGVGGKFKLDDNNKIIWFTEVFNTPAASLPELQERGKELFIRMIKTGNIDDYIKHPDYIEWPNDMTYYDTLRHEWLVKPGL